MSLRWSLEPEERPGGFSRCTSVKRQTRLSSRSESSLSRLVLTLCFHHSMSQIIGRSVKSLMVF
jgi:hypothetical protein